MAKLVHLRRRSFIVALIVIAFMGAAVQAEENTYPREGGRLASALNWHRGSVVADIGAGRGELTLIAARRAGRSGRVYATELDPKKLAALKTLTEKDKNITLIQAGESRTNLPPACCDSIFMRLVYHHFTRPAGIDASLFEALKPGGLLAVMDREPPVGSTRVEGVPENRVGHGMPQKILIEELSAAGFQVVKTPADWPSNLYCVIFRKPTP